MLSFHLQTMRNELLVGQFLAQSSFVALSVVVGASTATDLPTRLDALSAMDPLTGADEPFVSPVLKLAILITLLGKCRQMHFHSPLYMQQRVFCVVCTKTLPES